MFNLLQVLSTVIDHQESILPRDSNVQKYSLKSSQFRPLKAQSLLVSVLQYGRVSMDNSSSGAKYWEKCFIYEEALLYPRKEMYHNK